MQRIREQKVRISSEVSRKLCKLASLREGLKRLKPTLSRRFGVERLGLFGSCVRGQSRQHSDVDVLVEFSGKMDLLRFVELERFLADRTGAKIDLVSARALRPEFKDTILREVVYI